MVHPYQCRGDLRAVIEGQFACFVQYVVGLLPSLVVPVLKVGLRKGSVTVVLRGVWRHDGKDPDPVAGIRRYCVFQSLQRLWRSVHRYEDLPCHTNILTSKIENTLSELALMNALLASVSKEIITCRAPVLCSSPRSGV